MWDNDLPTRNLIDWDGPSGLGFLIKILNKKKQEDSMLPAQPLEAKHFIDLSDTEIN